ncbi:MAG: peptide deformylase [Acidobacteriota bacterium]
MPVRPLVRLGHPALRTPARAVDLDDLRGESMQQLIDDMFETMDDEEGVGLAAPQLGLDWQIFVYVAVDPERPDDSGEPKVLINPGVTPEPGDLVWDWEGCLSIPDLRGLVPRRQAVRVDAIDRRGEAISFRAEGYEARIIQHEFDHLNGIIFLDRMRDMRSLCYSAEWEQFMTSDDDGPAVG